MIFGISQQPVSSSEGTGGFLMKPEKKENLKRLSFVLLSFLMAFATFACGEFTVKAPESESTSANVNIIIPEYVSMKPAGQTAGAAVGVYAATIVDVKVTITAADMDTMTIPIPLDTLEAVVDVTSGDARTFLVEVLTATGQTFTGFQTLDLVPGGSADVDISITMVEDLIGYLSLIEDAWEIVDASGTETMVFRQGIFTHRDPDGCVTEGAFSIISSMTISGSISNESPECSASPDAWPINVPFEMTFSLSGDTLFLNGGPADNLTFTRSTGVEVLATPTNISAVANSDGTIDFNWNIVGGATSYTVYYSLTPPASSNWSTDGGRIEGLTAPPYSFSGTEGTTYYFTVKAFSATTESGFSVEVSATAEVVQAACPASLGTPATTSATASLTTDGVISFNWTIVTDATSYNVYYSETSPPSTNWSTDGAVISSLSAPPYEFTGTVGSTYYFQATAQCDTIESGFSTEASAVAPDITSSCPGSLSTPANASAYISGSNIEFNWNIVTDAMSYTIYYSETYPPSTYWSTDGGKITGNTAPPYTFSLGASGTFYYFQATAVCGATESGFTVETASETMP